MYTVLMQCSRALTVLQSTYCAPEHRLSEHQLGSEAPTVLQGPSYFYFIDLHSNDNEIL